MGALRRFSFHLCWVFRIKPTSRWEKRKKTCDKCSQLEEFSRSSEQDIIREWLPARTRLGPAFGLHGLVYNQLRVSHHYLSSPFLMFTSQRDTLPLSSCFSKVRLRLKYSLHLRRWKEDGDEEAGTRLQRESTIPTGPSSGN